MTDDRESRADGGADASDGSDDRDDDRFEPDPERVRLLRAVGDDVRGESSESRQVAAICYRVSDLYDPDEDTTPEEIYRNVRTILRVTERGTLARDRDRDGEDGPATDDVS